VGAEEFLKDLFNDRNVTESFGPLRGMSECSGVKFTHMTCDVLNMAYFDKFRELGLVTENGDIRQNYEERLDGIILSDRIRQALLWEETEDFEAWDELHKDAYQKEFIFKLFMHIQIGGAVNQFDNNIAPYLDVVKRLYKDLVCVAKDPESQQIKCHSHVLRIDKIEGCSSLYGNKYDQHP